MKDVREFIGQVHQVHEPVSGRKVTIVIADGGPSPAPDKRPLISLTVHFADGKRSDGRTAGQAVSILAAELLEPDDPGMMGSDQEHDWADAVERYYRVDGPKNGRTSYTFRIFAVERTTAADRAGYFADVEARFAKAKAELGR